MCKYSWITYFPFAGLYIPLTTEFRIEVYLNIKFG